MTGEEARAAFAAARVARLATVDEHGRPHLVPLVFALDGDVVFTAVDHKPKRTTALRRLANMRTNPAVALLVDHYDDEDWSVLWWARADGRARILDPGSEQARHGLGLLVSRYRQYASDAPDGPVVAIDVERWTGWSARP